MTPAEYRTFCESTYAAPGHIDSEEYLRLLLIEELGEVASLFAKAMRDGVRRTCSKCGGHGFVDNAKCTHCDRGGVTTYGAEAVDRDRLKKELGDVMWCAAMLSDVDQNYNWECSDRIFDSNLIRTVHGSSVGCSLSRVKSLCAALGFDPEDVALANVAKLRKRIADGTIHGAGDER